MLFGRLELIHMSNTKDAPWIELLAVSGNHPGHACARPAQLTVGPYRRPENLSVPPNTPLKPLPDSVSIHLRLVLQV
jgi:hypothetical protein